MKKALIMFFAVMVSLCFFACEYNAGDEGDATLQQNNQTPTKNRVKISVENLIGEVPPGDQLVAIYDIKADKPAKIYCFTLSNTTNYNLIDQLWIEDKDGNTVFGPIIIDPAAQTYWLSSQKGLNLKAGKTLLYLRVHIFGAQPSDSDWNPIPIIQMKLNRVEANAMTKITINQQGSGSMLEPRYTDYLVISSVLDPLSPAGDISTGDSVELIKLSFQTNIAWVWVNELSFNFQSPENFDGTISNCRLIAGDKLLEAISYDYGVTYIGFLPESQNPTLIIFMEATTVSLVCTVQTNTPRQELKMRLTEVWIFNYPEQYQPIFSQFPEGNELIFP